MCLNCGCGEPDTRHHPTDITRDDVQQAAKGSGMSMDETTANMRSALDRIQGGGREVERDLSAAR